MTFPRLVKNIDGQEGDSFPSSLTAAGNNLFFVVDSGRVGREIWKSDGTEAGTILVADINKATYYGDYYGTQSSNPKHLTAIGDTLFFSADDGISGEELWKTDGTSAGTVLVADISPGFGNYGYPSSSNPKHLTAVGDTLFFSADDGFSGEELWKTDGTSAGTLLVADVFTGIDTGGYPKDSEPRYLTAVGDTLFFAANSGSGHELWKSDGTEAGTVRVADADPRYLTAVGDTLYFIADSPNFEGLWKSDGTPEGTILVKDIFPINLTAVGDTLFFAANGDGGQELWRSDGTSEGTFQVADINKNVGQFDFDARGSNPRHLTAVGDILFFAADNGDGEALWKSDGSKAGTVLVANIKPGIDDEYYPTSNYLTGVGNTLFFVADDYKSGEELWQSDGTPAGTVLISDINRGNADSNPGELTLVDDTLFFYATDGKSGEELWALEVDPEPSTTSLALTTSSVSKTEGESGFKRFKFTVDRAGDLSSSSEVAWTVSGMGKNAASADDFAKGILPSGTVLFGSGQGTRTITFRVKGDRLEELNEKFKITLSNSKNATITTASAKGIIKNDDHIGTARSETIIGGRPADFINGLGGKDILTGGGGIDRFAFRYGQSRINNPDHITDFFFEKEAISLVNRKGKLLPVPRTLNHAAYNSTAETFKDLADAVFADTTPLIKGNQPLAPKSAALVYSSNPAIEGTYLLINNGKASLNVKKDLLINITGYNGIVPSVGNVPVDKIFG